MYPEDFLRLAIEYRDMSADISDMDDVECERLRRAVAAVGVLQIEEISSMPNRIGHMFQKVHGYPTVEDSIYDHFDTCIDKCGDVVSIMQPYDHVLSYDIRQELAYIAAGMALTDGPMRGFIGLLGNAFSWHNLNRTVLIAHTGSPTRRPDAFAHLLYYHFDSAEAAWWYLASHGKKCADRIVWFDEAKDCCWDQWWCEIGECEFAKYPWMADGSGVPFVFDEKTALAEYGYRCR